MIGKLVYQTISFQCKFSNVPGGCPRPDCSYFHPDRSAQAADGSRKLLHDRLQRSRSRSSRENNRSSPYFHPADRSPRGADGSSSSGQFRRSTSRSSRENYQSSPKHRLKGENKRSIQDAQFETNNPQMHGAEGDAPRLIFVSALFPMMNFFQGQWKCQTREVVNRRNQEFRAAGDGGGVAEED